MKEGDWVLGNFHGVKYAATVEKVFESSRAIQTARFFLVHWHGYKGKKAYSILRQCEVEKTTEKSAKLFKPVPAQEEVAVTVTVPNEVYDKVEFKLIYELFILPDKLKNLLLDQEEQIVEQQLPCPGQMSVRQALQLFQQETQDEEQCVSHFIHLFDKLAFENLLYKYELPYLRELVGEALPSDKLGAVYFVRLLSLMPELFACFARTKNLTAPNKQAVVDFEYLLSTSRRFASICVFFVNNFVRILGDDAHSRPQGLYYLPTISSNPSPTEQELISAEKTVNCVSWKRKKPNNLVKCK